MSSSDQKLPLPARKGQGCTCQTGGGRVALSSGLVLLAAIVFALRRRRR